MRCAFGSAAIAVGLSSLASAPAEAKTCKDVVTAKARSAAQLSDASRERRARDSAIANWSRRARDTYGWRYSFWRRARGAAGQLRRRRLGEALHRQRQALPPLAVIPGAIKRSAFAGPSRNSPATLRDRQHCSCAHRRAHGVPCDISLREIPG